MSILKEVIGVIARLDTQAIIAKEVNTKSICSILLLPHCTSKRFVTRMTANLFFSWSLIL